MAILTGVAIVETSVAIPHKALKKNLPYYPDNSFVYKPGGLCILQ